MTNSTKLKVFLSRKQFWKIILTLAFCNNEDPFNTWLCGKNKERNLSFFRLRYDSSPMVFYKGLLCFLTMRWNSISGIKKLFRYQHNQMYHFSSSKSSRKLAFYCFQDEINFSKIVYRFFHNYPTEPHFVTRMKKVPCLK